MRILNPARLGLLCIGSIVLLSIAMGATAAPVNLYTFNDGTANDSIGAQHGTVVDSGVATASYFTNGNQRQLDLRGNVGQSSNAITEDAYVNLPNGIISAAASGGTPGALSVSVWVTMETNRNWAEIFAFGTSNGGEDTSPGGSASPYIALIPDTGDGANTLRLTSHDASGAEIGASAANNAVLTLGIEHHLVGVFDQSTGLPGTLTLYADGTFVNSSAIAPNLDLNTFTNNNNWIGRSMWPDPLFDGMINELEIFNTALTQGDVTALFQGGPLAVPEPSMSLLVLAGLALACRRLR